MRTKRTKKQEITNKGGVGFSSANLANDVITVLLEIFGIPDKSRNTCGLDTASVYTAEFVSVHFLDVELNKSPVTRDVSTSKGVVVIISVKALKIWDT